ncbi:HAD hydrolase family protein [Agrobacterium vitis]
MTAVGKHLTSEANALLKALAKHVLLITAQAEDYCTKIGVEPTANLVTEKGFMTRINGVTTTKDAPPMVEEFADAMDELIKGDPNLFLNRKMAGYAVGHVGKDKPASWNKVLTLMNQQAASYAEVYLVEETAGFVDITMKSLSKATSLLEGMKHFPGHVSIACGDSRNTDGPMLKVADMGIMVSNNLPNFACVADHETMLQVLAWFLTLLN